MRNTSVPYKLWVVCITTQCKTKSHYSKVQTPLLKSQGVAITKLKIIDLDQLHLFDLKPNLYTSSEQNSSTGTWNEVYVTYICM